MLILIIKTLMEKGFTNIVTKIEMAIVRCNFQHKVTNNIETFYIAPFMLYETAQFQHPSI